ASDCRLLDARWVDVDSADLDIPRGGIGKVLPDEDGERVGLFSRSAPRGQNANLATTRVVIGAIGQHDLGESTEVIVVTKEVGLADGEGPGERTHFLRGGGGEPREIDVGALAPGLESLTQDVGEGLEL